MKRIVLIFIYLFNSYCFAQNWPPTTKTESSLSSVTIIECLTTRINSFKAKQLISNGCDLSVKGVNGESVLELAVKANMEDVVQILLLKKVDVNSTNSSGQTPLMAAAERGNIQMVKTLIEARANLNLLDNKKKDAFSYVMERRTDKIELIELFLKNGYDLKNFSTPQGVSFLSYSCRKNDFELVKYLVEQRGFNVDEVDSSGLDLIERNSFSSFELLKYLIEKKEKKKLVVYYFKIVNIGDANLLEYFLNCYKVDLNALDAYGETAIMSRDCSTSILIKLIEYGIDVNIRSTTGKSAIMYASYDLNLEKVMLLFYNGALLDFADINNWTTLDFAERSRITNNDNRKESLILFLKNTCNAKNGVDLKNTDYMQN